jgi:hypothetical protein
VRGAHKVRGAQSSWGTQSVAVEQTLENVYLKAPGHGRLISAEAIVLVQILRREACQCQ